MSGKDVTWEEAQFSSRRLILLPLCLQQVSLQNCLCCGAVRRSLAEVATGPGNPWRSLEKYDPDEELPHTSPQAYEAWSWAPCRHRGGGTRGNTLDFDFRRAGLAS